MRKSILSKRKYAAALKALSKTRDFTKISVTDICVECGLSRKGFYYHFADKFSLVAWILQHEFIDQSRRRRKRTPGRFSSFSVPIFIGKTSFIEKASKAVSGLRCALTWRSLSPPMPASSMKAPFRIRKRRIFSRRTAATLSRR